MALPTTIASTKFSGANYYQGPFLSSGGNVYVVMLDTTNSKIHVFKATDPTSSFTEQDSANVPAQTLANTTNAALWARQDSDILSIAAGDGTTTPAYKFHQFSMATDLWSTTIKDKAIASPTLGAATGVSISVVKRSNGDFIALFNGAKEQLMGAGWERVSYSKSTDGGSTWTAETAVGATGVKRAITGSIAILGASDRSHFFYSDTTANLKERSLSSADALDTEQAVNTTGGLAHNYWPGISFVSGGTTVQLGGYDFSSGGFAERVSLTSGANPTVNSPDISNKDSVFTLNGYAVGCCAIDGTTVHGVWSKLSSQHLIHNNTMSLNDEVDAFIGTVNGVSCNIYTRSGSKVLAYVMDDGGTIKYNEILIAGFPYQPYYAMNPSLQAVLAQ